LPDEPYEYAEWKRYRVNLDYHVEIAKHYYSVPYNSCIRRSRLASPKNRLLPDSRSNIRGRSYYN
jgi:hypothetical protein